VLGVRAGDDDTQEVLGARCEVLGPEKLQAGGEMTTIKSYRDLRVWERAMDLVAASYKLTELLPKSEVYGLTAQIRRAAVSIPANIAEGHGREHLGDYLHHLSVANGSLMELETHFLIANRLAYLGTSEIEVPLELSGEVSRMLAGLTKKLKARQAPNT
jgi:four helix bundle protein